MGRSTRPVIVLFFRTAFLRHSENERAGSRLKFLFIQIGAHPPHVDPRVLLRVCTRVLYRSADVADAPFALCSTVDFVHWEPVMTSKKHTALPAAGKQAEPSIDSTDSRLDEALEESFPASDPIAVHEHEPRRASENEHPVAEKKRR